MKRIALLLSGLALLAYAGGLSGQADGPKKLSDLMRKKLEHSQKVLEGIALNDFDKIAKNAEDLIDVSKAAEWRVLKTPRYEL